MTLKLNINPSVGPGRRTAPVHFEVVRDVNEADLALLAMPGESKAPALKKITDRHHTLARLIAQGTSKQDAAAIVGYTLSRVSILLDDPAFKELLSLYRKEAHDKFSSNLDHMRGLSRDALLELRDRIEDKPEKFTNNELRAIVVELNDRVERDDTTRVASLPDMIELVAPEPRKEGPEAAE